MNEGIGWLCLASAGVGLVHTAIGPDHYLPFLALAKAGRWSAAKTAMVTLLCGLGHVAGSLVIAAVGVLAGSSIAHIESIEAYRGDIAAWALIAFGLAYTIWGLRRAYRHQPHAHWHAHHDGTVHSHEHRHEREHVHVHTAEDGKLTPWLLFTLFLFGPCEPLIPLVMYPAAVGELWQAVPITLAFTAATLATMLGIVLVLHRFGERVPASPLQRFGHVLAGCVVLGCGLAVKLGL